MKSRYIIFVQQPYCCLPACLQMVLYRRWKKLINQEQIWIDLWLIVPEKDLHLFQNVKTGERPRAGRGTQAYGDHDINSFFKKYKYGLNETRYFVDKISKDFIISSIKENKDLLVCFNYHRLYGEGNTGWHLSIIDRLEWDDIYLIDPAFDTPKIRKVNYDKLIDAIEFHGVERWWGIWMIDEDR